jgi:Zn-finger nucleic acid-binding protein
MPRSRTDDPDVRKFKCPLCQAVMQRSAFGKTSGILVDVCAAHGTWFDRGELEQVIDFVRAGGLERRTGAADGDVEDFVALASAAFRGAPPRASAVDLVDILLRHW